MLYRNAASHSPPLPACLPAVRAAQGSDLAKYKELVKEKDGKINELVEELGNKEMLLSEAQSSLSKVGDERKELIALREMKEDVERRERAQADVIANQAKRLDELEHLYKDEALLRKKIHNQVGGWVVGQATEVG